LLEPAAAADVADEPFAPVRPQFPPDEVLDAFRGDPGTRRRLTLADIVDLDRCKVVEFLQVRVVRQAQQALEVERGLKCQMLAIDRHLDRDRTAGLVDGELAAFAFPGVVRTLGQLATAPIRSPDVKRKALVEQVGGERNAEKGQHIEGAPRLGQVGFTDEGAISGRFDFQPVAVASQGKEADSLATDA